MWLRGPQLDLSTVDHRLSVAAAMSTNLAIFLAKLGVFTFTGSKCVVVSWPAAASKTHLQITQAETRMISGVAFTLRCCLFKGGMLL